MNPLQRAAFRRKVIYLAVILGLFTVSMFWRGTLPIPLSGSARAGEAPSGLYRVADRVASRTILSQATGLELREVDEGEQEIEGSTRRLAFVGSRGLVVAYLWHSAIDKQKRNEFHEMDRLIRRVTQLQPHFITPWIFQSWNIAYNVSVEMQGSGDMFYYIARGIELLAEGERRQGRMDPETGRRLGSPDMRYQIAFYYQNKFGVSDTVEVLRCLFQLSCISPDERNPDELEPLNERGERVVDLKKFREFCEKYPHLVRRLRGEARYQGYDDMSRKKLAEALKCENPKDIIQFLRVNKDVPTRYKFRKELADDERQFPALPPAFAGGEEEAHPRMETKDDFTAYKAARAWFAYGCVPLPPNPTDWNGKPLPWRTPQVGDKDYDPVNYRIPRQPMLIIFRQGAPRAQTFQAEMEQKEGWFDDEGWQLDEHWFPGETVVIGGKESGRPKWSQREWQSAAEMWQKHGEQYGLLVEASRLKDYQTIASQPPPGTSANVVFSDPTPQQLEDPEFRKWYQATASNFFYQQNRQVTNFAFFLVSATAEGRSPTVEARKTLWKAENARKLGNKVGPNGAIELYLKGLRQWKQVLIADKDFHRPERSDAPDEASFTYELAYLRLLVQDKREVSQQATALARVVETTGIALPFPFAENWKTSDVTRRVDAAFKLLPPPFAGAWEDRPSPFSLPDALEEFKWYVAENGSPLNGDPSKGGVEPAPFAGVIGERDGITDERRGSRWVPDDVKLTVLQSQGVQRKPVGPPPGMTPPQMQQMPKR